MKKILIIFLLIMMIICFYQITNMYALYKAELEGEVTTELGVWSIKINETDISSGEQNITLTLSDDDFKIVSSDNVIENKIAPGTKLYVAFEIDPTNTDVAAIYNIELKLDEAVSASIEFLEVESYFEKSGDSNKITNEQFTMTGTKYTGLIPLDKINGGYVNKVKCYFVWKDTSNEIDSTIGTQEDLTWSIPIEINIKQYMGESY